MRQQLYLGLQHRDVGCAIRTTGNGIRLGSNCGRQHRPRLFGVIAQAGHGSNGELPVRYVFPDWPVTLGPCQRSEGRTIKPGSPAAFPVVPRRKTTT